VAEVQQAHPTASVELWGMDEHRIGLKPILRRVWCRKGQRPIAVVQHRYAWLYVYGWVRPTTGDTYWLLLPTVSIVAFTMALAEFARDIGVGPTKRLILLVDQAGWHVSKQVQLPEGIHLVFLPAYAPELQPAERLWSLSNEPLVNRHFPDLDALQMVQAEHCRTLRAMPDVIKAHTQFHWWPPTV
jgi:DDE superfamily endonuclease